MNESLRTDCKILDAILWIRRDDVATLPPLRVHTTCDGGTEFELIAKANEYAITIHDGGGQYDVRVKADTVEKAVWSAISQFNPKLFIGEFVEFNMGILLDLAKLVFMKRLDEMRAIA